MARSSAPDTKLRWSKFWWGDWQNDATLRMCGFSARGVWMEMLAIMHAAEPVGHLLVNNRSPSIKQLASLAGGPEKEVAAAVKELEDAGVFSRTSEGIIYSRRMVRDKVASDRGKVTGSAGGNPALKPNDAAPDNPSTNANPNGKGLTPPVQPPLKLEAEAEAEAERERKQQEAAAPNREPSMPRRSDPPGKWVGIVPDRTVWDDGTTHGVVGGFSISIAADLVCTAAKINDVNWPGDWKPIIGWLRDGIDLPTIVARVERVAARPSYQPPRSLAYFDQAVRERRA